MQINQPGTGVSYCLPDSGRCAGQLTCPYDFSHLRPAKDCSAATRCQSDCLGGHGACGLALWSPAVAAAVAAAVSGVHERVGTELLTVGRVDERVFCGVWVGAGQRRFCGVVAALGIRQCNTTNFIANSALYIRARGHFCL